MVRQWNLHQALGLRVMGMRIRQLPYLVLTLVRYQQASWHCRLLRPSHLAQSTPPSLEHLHPLSSTFLTLKRKRVNLSMAHLTTTGLWCIFYFDFLFFILSFYFVMGFFIKNLKNIIVNCGRFKKIDLFKFINLKSKGFRFKEDSNQ